MMATRTAVSTTFAVHANLKRIGSGTRRAMRYLIRRSPVFLARALIVAVLLGMWQLAASRGWISRLLFSDPDTVGRTIWKWLGDGTYSHNSWATIRTMMLGFAFGGLAGVVAGYLLGRSRRVADVLAPFITAFYTMPKLALAPLFIVWFGIGLRYEVVFTAVIVFFLVYNNTFHGVRDVPAPLMAAVRVMGGGRIAIARRVILPSALVWVVAGLRTSVPYALVGAIVAEMLVANRGLGYLIVRSSNQLFVAGIFAAIAALVVIGWIMDIVLSACTARALRWKTVHDE